MSAQACACGTCATCGGSAAITPRAVGDPQAFRHGAIRQRLLNRIASTRVGVARPLAGLGVRSSDDPAIALIDAHASSLHVLAWNVARLADDGTILRSEDRDALVDLGRLIGYEPRPALAASTTLAFTLETLPGAPATVIVPKGAKIASVPDKNEMPQVFETGAELEAKGAWNAIRAVSPRPEIDRDSTVVCAAGVTSSAKAGDMLAVPYLPQGGGSNDWVIAQIGEVKRISDPVDPSKSFTQFHLIGARQVETTPELAARRAGHVVILARRAAPFGANAPDARGMSEDLDQSLTDIDPDTGLRIWRDFVVGAPGAAEAKTIDLDSSYGEAFVGRIALLARAPMRMVQVLHPKRHIKTGADMEENDRLLHEAFESDKKAAEEERSFAAAQLTAPSLTVITKAVEQSRTDFLLSAKISRITIESIDLTDDEAAQAGTSTSLRYLVRELAVHLETENLTLYCPPLDVALPSLADRLELPGKVELPPGRRVALAGELHVDGSDQPGPRHAELATVREVQFGPDTTTVFFEANVTEKFHSTSLDLFGNCVSASHGETPATGEEAIGSGNTASSDQRFALKGKPLAYIPAETPRGYAPALEVRVNGRTFKEKPHLAGLGTADRAYSVRQGREGQSQVQIAGKLPTGINNVTALYRTGGGSGGNFDPGRLTMAMVPVLGVKAITNPVPADGGSDAETIEDIRRSAPLSVRTLDKVVSLADYEAFAAAYRGVGKALATQLFAGMRQVVCLTLADSQMNSPASTSDIVTGLSAELAKVAVPGRAVLIEGFVPIHPTLNMALAIDPSFRRKDIEEAVRKLLGECFGAAARPFARDLHRSEVLEAIQKVEGVIAAALTTFALPAGHPAESEGRLRCPGPNLDQVSGDFVPAGLLSIDPVQIHFAEMQP
jgi:predicted phage baseplate assembly protein